jgi:CheY-like chemotaxis protein
MSAVSMPVDRPTGRALVVGAETTRSPAVGVLTRLGYSTTEAADPYAAMAELMRQPQAFTSITLALSGLYKEELTIIDAVRRRFPQIEIWLTQTDGRAAAMADALRRGADGLLSDEGLHRLAMTRPAVSPPAAASGPPRTSPVSSPAISVIHQSVEQPNGDSQAGDPILSAEELRALLQEQTSTFPGDPEQLT